MHGRPGHKMLTPTWAVKTWQNHWQWNRETVVLDLGCSFWFCKRGWPLSIGRFFRRGFERSELCAVFLRGSLLAPLGLFIPGQVSLPVIKFDSGDATLLRKKIPLPLRTVPSIHINSHHIIFFLPRPWAGLAIQTVKIVRPWFCRLWQSTFGRRIHELAHLLPGQHVWKTATPAHGGAYTRCSTLSQSMIKPKFLSPFY